MTACAAVETEASSPLIALGNACGVDCQDDNRRDKQALFVRNFDPQLAAGPNLDMVITQASCRVEDTPPMNGGRNNLRPPVEVLKLHIGLKPPAIDYA